MASGDPELWFAVGPYGDVDLTATKTLLLDGRDKANLKRYFELNFGKRPAFELYDLRNDPDQTINVADRAEYKEVLLGLTKRLQNWMKDTSDPRADALHTDFWDRAPYLGSRAKQ